MRIFTSILCISFFIYHIKAPTDFAIRKKYPRCRLFLCLVYENDRSVNPLAITAPPLHKDYNRLPQRTAAPQENCDTKLQTTVSPQKKYNDRLLQTTAVPQEHYRKPKRKTTAPQENYDYKNQQTRATPEDNHNIPQTTVSPQETHDDRLPQTTVAPEEYYHESKQKTTPPQENYEYQANTGAQEDYDRMSEDGIKESYYNGKREELHNDVWRECGALRCKRLETQADGHCYYHAMTLSIYYGQYKRRNVPSAKKIIDEMVKRLLSDVMEVLNLMPFYFEGEDAQWVDGFSNFDTSLAACKALGVKPHALEIFKALHKLGDLDALKYAGYFDIVCRYPEKSDHRHSNAVSLFREQTYIPGVDEIRNTRGRKPELNPPLTGTEICVYHEEKHSYGLDCTGDPNPPQLMLASHQEISYDNDPKFDEVCTHLVGSQVRVDGRHYTILEQPNRQLSYLHAVYTSAQHAGFDLHPSIEDQTKMWVKSATNLILKDKKSFNKALQRYEDLIAHSQPSGLVTSKPNDYKGVLPFHHIDYFLGQLKKSVEIGAEVEQAVRRHRESDEDLSRHLVFSIYCFINGLGIFVPTAELLNDYAKPILGFGVRQCLYKGHESLEPDHVFECASENVVTGLRETVVVDAPHGKTVSVVSTIIRLEQMRKPEVHYFGMG